jgi:hypothetical protein
LSNMASYMPCKGRSIGGRLALPATGMKPSRRPALGATMTAVEVARRLVHFCLLGCKAVVRMTLVSFPGVDSISIVPPK